MRPTSRVLLALAVALAALPITLISNAQNAPAPAAEPAGTGLKDAYKGHFLIGCAGDVPGGFSDEELAIIKKNFNIITPENYLKPAPVHPLEDVWATTRPDALIKWCNENNIKVHGHTLLWHAQTNGWFFQGGDKQTIINRMKDHIQTLVGRYKGKVYSWDVVNEAINDGGGGAGGGESENLRQSQWLNSVGPEFLTMAFKFAHEADPDLKLFYNDYNIENGAKHTASMNLLRRLIKDGAPIYGVGIQGHWSTNGLPYAALDRAISDYASLGLKVAISELDITINGQAGGQLDPAVGGPPGGGARGRRGGATNPATGPANLPGPSAFTVDNDQLYFAAAPAGGARGGARGGPGRGGAQPPVNPIDSIAPAVSDLTDAEKEKLTTAATGINTKLAAWQKSSQAALLSVAPQYTPGQVAYDHEVIEYNAEQVKQNALRDAIYNDAEAQAAGILTPAQGEKWQSARLNAVFTTTYGTLNITDAQKAKADTIIAASAKKLAISKTAAEVAAGKDDFHKQILALLDQAQVTQMQAQANRGGAGRGGAGRGGNNTPSAAALKTQADAYARIFAIFEKHKESMDHVTIWGLNDPRSWRTGQSPTLFDANNKPKPAYDAILNVLAHPESIPAIPGVTQ